MIIQRFFNDYLLKIGVKPWALILFTVVLVIGLNLSSNLRLQKQNKRLVDQEFCGVIDRIDTDDRGLPLFIINDVEIGFGGYGYNIAQHIEIDDSVYSEIGSSIVIIFKGSSTTPIAIDFFDNSSKPIQSALRSK